MAKVTFSKLNDIDNIKMTSQRLSVLQDLEGSSKNNPVNLFGYAFPTVYELVDAGYVNYVLDDEEVKYYIRPHDEPKMKSDYESANLILVDGDKSGHDEFFVVKFNHRMNKKTFNMRLRELLRKLKIEYKYLQHIDSFPIDLLKSTKKKVYDLNNLEEY